MRTGVLTGGYLALVGAYAALSTVWVSHDPGWYAGLQRPWFQPPDVVFGIIWPLNFLALAWVGVLLARDEPELGWRLLPVYFLMVVAALSWAYLFYVPHALVAAAIALATAAALTWALVVLLALTRGWWGLLLVPYACWMSVATALSVGYARLN